MVSPLLFLLVFVSCKKEPAHITVQHILVAFEGSIPKETVTRTQEEAEKLAVEILDRAQDGGDFDKLVKDYSDDQYPGVYRLANYDVDPAVDQGEFSRSRMVKSFGDVSFKLPVDGIGLATYDPEDCKYGWHIIKRIE
jgi:foldase protein PrsA